MVAQASANFRSRRDDSFATDFSPSLARASRATSKRLSSLSALGSYCSEPTTCEVESLVAERQALSSKLRVLDRRSFQTLATFGPKSSIIGGRFISPDPSLKFAESLLRGNCTTRATTNRPMLLSFVRAGSAHRFV